MKILIVNKFLYPNGGSETYIFKIGEQLVKMGHSVEFFGMEHENRCVGNHAESYTSGMDFHTGKLQKLLYPFKIIYSLEARRKIRLVLDDFAPDAVHLNNFNFQLTPSVLYEIRKYEKQNGRKIRIIYTAHDSQLVCPNHLMQNPVTGEKCMKCLDGGAVNCVKGRCIHGSRVKSILAAIEHCLFKSLKTYRMIDLIICPSQFLKERLQTDSVLAPRLVVLHNFVDVRTGKEMPKKDYVLYFGRYSLEKGIGTLLQVCRSLPQISFIFAGDGPLAEQVNAVSNIRNVGFVSGEELWSLIARARFTVFPSECYENCPFAVMESLLCRTPVIGSDAGGVPELIEQGKTGELFESGNGEQLKEKITGLWENRTLCETYTENCGTVTFDTVAAYCEKLCQLYAGER
ncbi:MAG: glycosyltransferase family 4 protein [Eubacteriales bacterium]|nr:glycosyltransferase family 4 protein [Eubacteriales bacterium]